MSEHYVTTAATINRDKDIIFPFPLVDIGKLDTGQSFSQNAYPLSEFDFINYQFRGIKKWVTPESSGQNTSKEIEFGTTQELADTQIEPFNFLSYADTQIEPFNFLSYNEEDLLDWDAAIITPPPRPSRTVRVKVKYKGRSKPFPVENFWEE